MPGTCFACRKPHRVARRGGFAPARTLAGAGAEEGKHLEGIHHPRRRRLGFHEFGRGDRHHGVVDLLSDIGEIHPRRRRARGAGEIERNVAPLGEQRPAAVGFIEVLPEGHADDQRENGGADEECGFEKFQDNASWGGMVGMGA